AFVLAAFLTGGGLATAGDEQIASLFSSSYEKETAGQIDQSLADVLKILRLSPNHYIANYRAAWLYYLKGSYDNSVKFYEKAASLKSGAIEPRLALLLPLMAAENWSKAQSIAEDLNAKAPTNYYAGSRLAYIYYAQGKYAEAERQYKAVLAAYPSEYEMTLGLGWTYLKMGRKEDARAAFNEVLTIRADNLSARTGLESL
ncbi:tetratricopeptide repeat protein, partial [bacterium]|nr:tetratricopeptide repeat protein [bacterium]